MRSCVRWAVFILKQAAWNVYAGRTGLSLPTGCTIGIFRRASAASRLTLLLKCNGRFVIERLYDCVAAGIDAAEQFDLAFGTFQKAMTLFQQLNAFFIALNRVGQADLAFLEIVHNLFQLC